MMGIGSMFGKICLREIVKLSPHILVTAQQVYRTVRENRERGGSDIPLRLEALESAAATQAELTAEVARQIGALTSTLTVLSKRLVLAVCLSAAALVAAVIALIRTF